MSKFYHTIYYRLCEGRKSSIDIYGPGSGIHKHHIIPTHSGGLDSVENVTYLTVREHQIAHFLLWKMNKNPNDLRSMHMLGARLTPNQRKITGIFCRDNKIGMFGASKEQQKEWKRKGLLTQKLNYEQYGITNSAYYWKYSEEGKKRRASMGGTVGSRSQIRTKTGIFTDDLVKRKVWATSGGKAHIGKRWMYHPEALENVRAFPSKINYYLEIGYVFGMVCKKKN